MHDLEKNEKLLPDAFCTYFFAQEFENQNFQGEEGIVTNGGFHRRALQNLRQERECSACIAIL